VPLPAAEHQRVLRETKEERNARAWVRRRKGWVRATPYHGDTLYIVRVPGFHPAAALRLEQAVAQLQHTVASWTGEKGSTGARLREPDGN
jgi:hypothetical protein